MVGPGGRVGGSTRRGKTGDRGTVIDLLEGAAPALDSYWGEQARRVMSTLPAEEIVEWRARRLRAVETAQGRSRWRAVGLWATLEPDPRQLEGIRQEVGGSLEVGESFSEAWFRQGLAVELWNIGLETEAGRWDPTGFPNTNAVRSAWTAARFVEFGMPWSAIRMADGAWRQAGSEVPDARVLPGFPEDCLPVTLPDAGSGRGEGWGCGLEPAGGGGEGGIAVEPAGTCRWSGRVVWCS